MRVLRIAIGAVICVAGALMLVVAMRQGGQQIMGPLALIGAGALAISPRASTSLNAPSWKHKIHYKNQSIKPRFLTLP